MVGVIEKGDLLQRMTDIENLDSYLISILSNLKLVQSSIQDIPQFERGATLPDKITPTEVKLSKYYPASPVLSGYLGLGLGASYVDVDWAKDKYGFSTSIFGGLEYKFSDRLALNTQVRWLGTVVDNDTSGVCTIPNNGQECIIRFDTDWMNQFQANVGLSFTF